MSHKQRHPVALAAAVLVGVLASIQSRINGELGKRLSDGVLAAFISFGLGLIIVGCIVSARPDARRATASIPSLVREGRLKSWMLIGGMGGATFVVGQGTAVPVLGVAVFTVVVVAGSTLSSLFVDRAGLGPAGIRPITSRRLVAAALAIAAVAISVAPKLSGGNLNIPYLIFAFVAGIVTAAQLAVNGRVSVESGHPLAAALVNFVAGITAISAFLLIRTLLHGWQANGLPADAWLYLGAPIGVAFITVSAAVVRTIGVLGLTLASVAGQLVGAIIVDLVAPASGEHLTLVTVASTALTFVAVAVGAQVSLKRTPSAVGG